MPIELETHPNYHLERTSDFFAERGWKVETVAVSNIDLVMVDPDSAMECIDGRFANIDRKKNGPKIPGGLNYVTAMKTGGGPVGFNSAAAEARRLGVRAGTHAKCGYFGLWANGALEAAVYEFSTPTRKIEDLGQWVKGKAKIWGGKHFYLPGEHEEEALVLNPYMGTTIEPRADRFIVDKWFINALGIERERGLLSVAEVVEKIALQLDRPEIKKVEILVP